MSSNSMEKAKEKRELEMLKAAYNSNVRTINGVFTTKENLYVFQCEEGRILNPEVLDEMKAAADTEVVRVVTDSHLMTYPTPRVLMRALYEMNEANGKARVDVLGTRDRPLYRDMVD